MSAGYVPAPDVAGPLPGGSPVPAPAPAPVAPTPAPPAPAPAPIAGLPDPPPPAPPQVGVDPTANFLPTSPQAVAQQGVQQTQRLGQEQVQNVQEKNRLEQQQADEKAKFDAAHAVALEQFQKQQEMHRQAADAEISAKRQQYEQQPFTTLWGKASTGRKVAIALGILAGGVSWNSNHTNRAVEMLNQAEQEHLNLQKEQHADLWRDLQLSLEGRKDLDARQLHEVADWQALESAKWDSVASKLNSLVAANRGARDATAAKQAALDATEKANQAWQTSINAKSTANHLDASAQLAREEAKTQESVREKNLAEAANNRALAANGGLDKFSQQLVAKIPQLLQRDPDVKTLYGSPGQPGPLNALPKIAQIQEDIKGAIANHDNDKLAQAVIAAREQLPKLFTGTDVTKPKAELLESLKGNPEELKSKLGKLLGNPDAGGKFAHELYGLLDDAREAQLKIVDQSRNRLRARHLSPNNPMARNPAVRAELENNINALTEGVTNGGGGARYPEGGATPVQSSAAPVPAPAQAKPAKLQLKGVTYTLQPDGTYR